MSHLSNLLRLAQSLGCKNAHIEIFDGWGRDEKGIVYEHEENGMIFNKCFDLDEVLLDRILDKIEQTESIKKVLETMPIPYERRAYDDKPGGYLESDRDYFENNRWACRWFLENAKNLKTL